MVVSGIIRWPGSLADISDWLSSFIIILARIVLINNHQTSLNRGFSEATGTRVGTLHLLCTCSAHRRVSVITSIDIASTSFINEQHGHTAPS